MPDALFDPWAPHPIVNRHICFGGSSGDTYNAPLPTVPNYSQYIQQMTNMGGYASGWAQNLQSWAQSLGVNLNQIASTAGTALSSAGTTALGWGQGLMNQWSNLTGGLYQGLTNAASGMISNLPAYEEKQAGAAGASASQGVQQQKQATIRSMEAQGLAPNAAATGALDTEAGTQTAEAVTSASEVARQAARAEAINTATGVVGAENPIANTALGQSALGGQFTGQGATIPSGVASQTAGLYNPSLGYYQSAYPYYAQWGQTMGQSFNENLGNYSAGLQAFQANQEAGANSPLSTIGAVGGGILASYLGGPAGGMIGSKIGGMLGSAASGSSMSGSGWTFAHGGAVDTVPPSASPSRGRRTDDVHAALSVGEFVIPKRTVDYYGDKFFHNLINKGDKEQGLPPQTIGPEAKPSGAIMTQPPMFRSEGART